MLNDRFQPFQTTATTRWIKPILQKDTKMQNVRHGRRHILDSDYLDCALIDVASKNILLLAYNPSPRDFEVQPKTQGITFRHGQILTTPSTTPTPIHNPHKSPIRALHPSSLSTHLISIDASGMLCRFNLHKLTLEQQARLPGPVSVSAGLARGHQGLVAAAGAVHHCVWVVESGGLSVVREFSGHRDRIVCL